MKSPTDILIAVLHCVGPKRIKNDAGLCKVFDEASRSNPILFRTFRRHPVYGDCPGLDEQLSVLHLGGSIGYWTSDIHCPFSATDAVLGEYGKAILDDLYPQDKEAVEFLAHKIKELR